MNKSCRIILLLMAIFAQVYYSNETKAQAVNKNETWRAAQGNEFPYMANIVLISKHYCYGSIIHEYFILTVAQCAWVIRTLKIVSPKILKIVVGNNVDTETSKAFEIQQVLLPKQYKYSGNPTPDNIALIQLAKPIEFSDAVKAVSLADELPKEGEKGWLSTYQLSKKGAKIFQSVYAKQLPVLSTKACKKRYPEIKDEFVCVKAKRLPKGGCFSIGGSPFVVGGKQVGVTPSSWSCGGEDFPELYMSVAYHREWIQTKIKENAPAA